MTFAIDATHDLSRTSWVEGAHGHAEFPIQNLPYAIFRDAKDGEKKPGVAIGDFVLDLGAAAEKGLFQPALVAPLRQASLNALLALPSDLRRELRHRIFALLSDEGKQDSVAPLLRERAACRLELPTVIGDYTDFYVGIHHATNVGRLFRPDTPLLPNYKYVPIGYHGRASSIRPSGNSVVRPNGQRKSADSDVPSFGPTKRLDYELELGIWIGQGNALGHPVPIEAAADHVGGFCLLNDWSARDLQTWEYQPLGPFLAKNFHSTISPWIITPEALAPFWQAQPERPAGDPRPLPYLWSDTDQARGALAIELSVSLASQRMRDAGMPPLGLSRGSALNMYWTVAQILTHHSSNGCNLGAGDLLGTGTISGPTREGFGSLLEISRNGSEPIKLPTGERRTFVEDGDEVILSATANRAGYASIGFGECRAVVLPAPAT